MLIFNSKKRSNKMNQQLPLIPLPEGTKYPELEWCQNNVYRLTQYYIEANYHDFYIWLMTAYPADMRLSERLYRFYHPDVENVCELCGKPTAYINFSKGFHKHCSTKCSSNNKKTRDKQKATSLKKYGVENPNQAQSVKDKQKATLLARYGVEHALQYKEFREKAKQTTMKNFGVYYPGQSEEVKEKIRVTNLEKYGTESSFRSEKVKEKIKATNIKRLGVAYPMQSADIREKSKEACMEKYGVEYASQSPEIREKIKATNIERYGVESPLQNPDIMQKVINTNIERYGVPNPLQNPAIRQRVLKTFQDNRVKNNDFLIGYTASNKMLCKCPHPECTKCEEKCYEIDCATRWSRVNDGTELCTKLLPIQTAHIKDTSIEIAVRGMLDECGIEYITSDRKILNGKELDIYIPELNTAIECNGVYWHDDDTRGAKYHMNKWRACGNKGISLISLWEDWIVKKPLAVRSLLLAELGVADHLITVDPDEIYDVSDKEARAFVEVNGLFDYIPCEARRGFRDENGELVALMNFKHVRKPKGQEADEDAWEITYFGTKIGTCADSWIPMIVSDFISRYKPSVLYAYTCNDLTSGWQLISSAFTPIEEPEIMQWYIGHKKDNRYRRIKATHVTKASIISKGLAPVPDAMEWTVQQAMEAAGWLRISDSGWQKWRANIGK